MLCITFFILSILFVFHYQSICRKTFLSRLKHLKKNLNKFTVSLIQIKNRLRWESFKQIFSLLQTYFLLTLYCVPCTVSGAMQRPPFFRIVLLQNNLCRAAVCVKLEPR